MKAFLSVLFGFLTFVTPTVQAQITNSKSLKEVTLEWSANTTMWEGRPAVLPCLEPFYIKIKKVPSGSEKILVKIYDSKGESLRDSIDNNGNRFKIGIDKVNLKEACVAVASSDGEFSALVSSPLYFRRFYFVEIERVSSKSVTRTVASRIASTLPEPLIPDNPTRSVPDTLSNTGNEVIVKTIENTIVPVSPPAASANEDVTITTVRQVTTSTKRLSEPCYAIPLQSEVSRFEFLASIGSAGIGQKGLKKFDSKFGFLMGLKIKLAPVSTNPNIGRYGLFPKASRWAIFLGSIVNEVVYKTTTISPVVFGLKPAIGIDYEVGKGALGITAGTFFGNQNSNAKLSSDKHAVAGIYLGLSLSLDLFNSLRANLPASQNFPSTINQPK